MKNPLNKRYFRELKNDFGKYIALCLFLIVTIGFCSGFLVADGSTKGAYDESFEKYNIEDGHFILAKEADSSLIDKLEKENLSIGQLFYKDVDRKNNHTIRLYKNRTKVNKVCLMDGNMPKADDEIASKDYYKDMKAYMDAGKVRSTLWNQLPSGASDVLGDDVQGYFAGITDEDQTLDALDEGFKKLAEE